jgi:hypothetical protein
MYFVAIIGSAAPILVVFWPLTYIEIYYVAIISHDFLINMLEFRADHNLTAT